MKHLQSSPEWRVGAFGAQSGVEWGAIPVAALSLVVFGIAYNLVIHELHRRGLNEGYVWLEVVVGVAVTLIVAGTVIGWEATAALFILFAASGIGPAVGDIYRYVCARRAEARGDDVE